MVQPTLKLDVLLVRFGTTEMFQKNMMTIQLTNTGSITLSWHFKHRSTLHAPLKGFAPQKIAKGDDKTPFSAEPNHGALEPGRTQLVTIIFSPIFSQYLVVSELDLLTSTFEGLNSFWKCKSMKTKR